MEDVFIIENTREAQDKFGYNHGSSTLILNKEQLQALLEGKMLANDGGEYVTFIVTEEAWNKRREIEDE